MRKTLLIGMLALLVSLLVVTQLLAQQQTEKIDLNVIHKIKTAEIGNAGGGGGGRGGGRGPNRPPLMETMYNLTDRYGPRLTNSPQYRAAGDWAVSQLKEWGLSNVHLEPFTTVPPPVPANNVKDSICSGSGAREPRGGLKMGRRNHCG
jgi:carboxypeptidase Q